jgi:hypothetical protein
MRRAARSSCHGPRVAPLRRYSLTDGGYLEVKFIGAKRRVSPRRRFVHLVWARNRKGRVGVDEQAIQVTEPGVGSESQGAGLAVTNVDSNPRPEPRAYGVRQSQFECTFRYRVGFN